MCKFYFEHNTVTFLVILLVSLPKLFFLCYTSGTQGNFHLPRKIQNLSRFRKDYSTERIKYQLLKELLFNRVKYFYR